MGKFAYTGFWDDFSLDNILLKTIQEVCQLEMVHDIYQANYLLYSVFSNDHWFVSDDVIKIFYTGENVTPDFNACDYAIGFDWMDFGDRYLRFPLFYLYDDICELMESKHQIPVNEIIKNKLNFCSITISNTKRNTIFKELFERMSAYKKVDSGGYWANNIGGPIEDKFSFDLSHKFSLVCENSSYPGYTTEKLVQAFAANCIPIYWGDPEVGRVFNKKAFVNVLDYESISDVIEIVKRIDNDPDLYQAMLREPALADNQYKKENMMNALKSYLSGIFNTPIEKARRRNRDCRGEMYISAHQRQVKESVDIFSKMRQFIGRKY